MASGTSTSGRTSLRRHAYTHAPPRHRINELRDAIYLNAFNKGFYRDQLDILAAIEDTATADEINAMKVRAMHLFTAQRIALIHSEVSEALEADRKNRRADLASFNEQVAVHGYRDADFQKYVKDTFEDEVADAIIRLLVLCGMMDIDISTSRCSITPRARCFTANSISDECTRVLYDDCQDAPSAERV